MEVTDYPGEAAEIRRAPSSQIDDILSRQRVTLESGVYPITMYLVRLLMKAGWRANDYRLLAGD